MVPVPRPCLKAGEARQLQRRIIVGADAVDADDALPPVQKSVGDMETDKAGGTGDKNHGLASEDSRRRLRISG
jgi:hypothetical protein